MTHWALVGSLLLASASALAQPSAPSEADAADEHAQVDAAGEPSPADASDESARRVYLEGRDAFDEGRYEDALRLFEAAYELSGRPELLYNIGTTADRLRRNRRALEAFEQYLQARPNSDNRSAVEVRIGVIRAELEREEQLQRSLQQAQQQPDELQQPQAAERAETRPRRRWWIGVLVGGLVLAATSVALGVALRDDKPQYITGDDGRLVFTLEQTR